MKKDESVFERLTDALDSLPNGFPRTPSRVEILILKKIFSEEEALLASQLTATYEPIAELAERFGSAEDDLKTRLVDMSKRGLVWMSRKDAKLVFRLAPFVVGIYESQLENMDHEFAHLFEEYMDSGGAAGIMKPQPALHRVVPAQDAVKSEWILPYDDIKLMLENSKNFRVRDCICRVQQDALNGRKCDFPVKNCITFSPVERPKHPNDITKEEAIALLDESEEIGLVHTVSNVIKDVYYVCNCCGCCCAILRGITDWGIEQSVARANYYAVIDADACNSCGICVERCQVKAIVEKDDAVVVQLDKCIGCGLCVTGCPVQAAMLVRKPDKELIDPPDDFNAWEKKRVENRGLHEKM
ncbi:MAG: 4Fe-4S binding protein [candidate division WOR-3 bacterium]|nr:4Fe-4S binding protein [candidate division WOR-3 bacterium]